MTTRHGFLCASMLFLLACAGSQTSGGDEEEAAVANMNLGVGYLRQGRNDLAIERLNRALEIDSRLAPAHSTLAIAYDNTGQLDLAEEHHRRATELAPRDGAMANNYAVFLCRQRRWTDAKPYFEQAAQSPQYQGEVAMTNAGDCAVGSGDIAAAEEQYRAALQRRPDYPDALQRMIQVSVAETPPNYLQARAFTQRYLATNTPTPTVLLACAEIEVALNDMTAAERCATRLREGFSDSPEAGRLPTILRGNGR